MGAGVLVAATAEIALQVLGDAVPDLILVDLATPGIGGVALARRLRADTLCRQIKLVAITGLSGSDHWREIIAGGFDAQLDKPMTVPELETVRRRLLTEEGRDPEA